MTQTICTSPVMKTIVAEIKRLEILAEHYLALDAQAFRFGMSMLQTVIDLHGRIDALTEQLATLDADKCEAVAFDLDQAGDEAGAEELIEMAAKLREQAERLALKRKAR